MTESIASQSPKKSIVEMYRDAEAEVTRLREANRRLHRRVQASESRAAQTDGKRIEALEAELARAKLERHNFRNENRFMKSERERLKRQLKEAKA